jgi:hypothetical protein
VALSAASGVRLQVLAQRISPLSAHAREWPLRKKKLLAVALPLSTSRFLPSIHPLSVLCAASSSNSMIL